MDAQRQQSRQQRRAQRSWTCRQSNGDGGEHAPATCGRGVSRRRRERGGSGEKLRREPSRISSATHRTHHLGAQLQQPNIRSERRRRKSRHSGAISTTTAMPTLPRSLSPAYLDRIGNVGHNPLLQPRLLVLQKLETVVIRAESRRVSIINKYLKQRLDTQRHRRFVTRLDSSHHHNSTLSRAPARTRPRSTFQWLCGPTFTTAQSAS